MRIKKILIIVPTDRLAGAESTLKKVALEFKSRGYKVKIIILSRGDNGMWPEFSASEIHYIKSTRESLGFIKALPLFIDWKCTKMQFDFVFTSHIHCNAFVGVLRKIKFLNCNNAIYRESTTPFSWYKGRRLLSFKIMYSLYNYPEKLVCQTEKMKAELLSNCPTLPAHHVCYQANPVDFKLIKVLSRNNVETKASEIVTVGRLVPEKDFQTLIKAFGKISKVKTKTYLRFIGEGPLLADLEALVAKLGLSEKVIFSGFCRNPMPYMKRSEVCVVSSQIEGFPNVLLEMMAVARRVVSTECADGISNLPGIQTCQISNAEQLANSILNALDKDKEEFVKNIYEMRQYVEAIRVDRYVDNVFFDESKP